MSNILTSQQQEAAYANTSVVVTAGAGTGKTHMLTERYLSYLQERNLSPLEIVAPAGGGNLLATREAKDAYALSSLRDEALGKRALGSRK